MPGELASIDHVGDPDRAIVGQSELPHRHLEVTALRRVRIEIDEEQQEGGAILRPLAVIEDLVVPEIVEGEAAEILQRRLLAADPVEEGDVLADVALGLPVEGADLVFLGVEILFLARHGQEFAQLEAGIDAVIAAERSRQRQPGLEAGAAADLQIDRVDVRRVDEEIRPHVLGAFFLRQFGQIFGQLRLGVAPGEVGIGLVVADLGKPLHHLGPGEGLGEEDRAGIDTAHLGDHPLPEGERLGVRIVDAEDPHALVQPEQHDVAQGVPDRRQRAAVEMDVDDVLVFLRRVLGVFDGSVRPPVEPFRMLPDPRMVGRALDGEVDGDLQPVVARSRDQPGEILEIAELRMDGVVAALGRTDGIGAAGIGGAGRQGVVATLAVGGADGVDRREIEDVEAHFLDVGQAVDDVVEGPVAIDIAGLGAWEELVPGGKARRRAIHPDRDVARIAREVGALAGDGQQRDRLGVLQQMILAVGVALRLHGFQLLVQPRNSVLLRPGAPAGLAGRANQFASLGQFQIGQLAGIALLLRLVAPRRVQIAPGNDREAIRARLLEDDLGRPAIVLDEDQRGLVPLLGIGRPVDDGGGDLVMAIGKDVRLDDQRFAFQPLHRETPAIDLRGDRLDRDAVLRERQESRLAGWSLRRLAGRTGCARGLDCLGHENPSPDRKTVPRHWRAAWKSTNAPGAVSIPSPAVPFAVTAKRPGIAAVEEESRPQAQCSVPPRIRCRRDGPVRRWRRGWSGAVRPDACRRA